MPVCTHRGCGKEFSSENPTPCSYHPGAPVFHEGLKSWSCCKDVNKPVLEFDQFMAIPGCATGEHTTEKQDTQAAVAPESRVNNSQGSTPAPAQTKPQEAEPAPRKEIPPEPVRDSPAPNSNGTSGASTPFPISAEANLEDPPDAVIPEGAKCKRKACGIAYKPGMERSDDECCHHPGETIFHEGSKGYSCCKRRVLEFDQFLQIEGCKKGKHLFVGKPNQTAEAPKLRMDHYQTPSSVIVSVFGKGMDKEKSKVTFEAWDVHMDLLLPNNQRYQQSLPLYGPIDTEKSNYKILSTKCELDLVKADGRSWATLEASNVRSTYTFGVGGKFGSVGSKDMVLDEGNKR